MANKIVEVLTLMKALHTINIILNQLYELVTFKCFSVQKFFSGISCLFDMFEIISWHHSRYILIATVVIHVMSRAAQQVEIWKFIRYDKIWQPKVCLLSNKNKEKAIELPRYLMDY